MDEAKPQNPTKNLDKPVRTDGLSKKEKRALKAAQTYGVGFGKVNLGDGVPEENIPPPQMQHGDHISPGQDAGNLLPMDQWQRYPGPRQGLPQSEPQVGQPQGPLPSGLMQQTNPEVGIRQSSTPFCTAGTNCKQAMQQLMMILKSPSTLEQRQHILHILKANPQVMAAFIKQKQAGPQVGQPQGPLPSGLMQQMNPEVGVWESATPFTAGTDSKQALQQLLMALKSPSTPEQQRQILHILKANPQLMAAFIKQRQLNLQQQQAELHPNSMQVQNVQQQQHQQWLKQNQLIMQVQQQQHQQQQQFQQPPAYQRSPGIRQPHLGYTNQIQEQNFAPMTGLQLTPPPVLSPQGGVMGPPQGSISLQQQHQLIQSVRSLPPITSPQPNPSPRLALSPRQPVPSPREPQLSPHELTEMFLGQNSTGLYLYASPARQAQNTGDMTPQD